MKLYSLMNKITINKPLFEKRMHKVNFLYLNKKNLYKYTQLIKKEYDSNILKIVNSKKKFIVHLRFIPNLKIMSVPEIKDNLKKIVVEIKKIHGIKIIKKNNNNFFINLFYIFLKLIKNPLNNYKKYENYIIKEANIPINNMSLCHNDLHNNNIVIINNKIKLIDWDFLEINDYHYDLASLASECDLSNEEIKKICKYYSKNTSHERVNKLIIVELIIFAMWGNFLYEKTANNKYLKITIEKNKKLESKF